MLTAGCMVEEAAVHKGRRGGGRHLCQGQFGRAVAFGEHSHCASIQIPLRPRDGDALVVDDGRDGDGKSMDDEC